MCLFFPFVAPQQVECLPLCPSLSTIHPWYWRKILLLSNKLVDSDYCYLQNISLCEGSMTHLNKRMDLFFEILNFGFQVIRPLLQNYKGSWESSLQLTLMCDLDQISYIDRTPLVWTELSLLSPPYALLLFGHFGSVSASINSFQHLVSMYWMQIM